MPAKFLLLFMIIPFHLVAQNEEGLKFHSVSLGFHLAGEKHLKGGAALDADVTLLLNRHLFKAKILGASEMDFIKKSVCKFEQKSFCSNRSVFPVEFS